MGENRTIALFALFVRYSGLHLEAFKREALRFLKLTIPLCVFLALSLFAAAVIEAEFFNRTEFFKKQSS